MEGFLLGIGVALAILGLFLMFGILMICLNILMDKLDK